MRWHTPMITFILCSISSTPQPKARRQLGNHLHQRLAFRVVHAGGRLVEQREGRLQGERPGDADTALIAIGKAVAAVLGLFRKAHPVEDFARLLPGRPARKPAADCGDRKVLLHRHRPEETRRLETAADTGLGDLAGRELGNVDAVEADAAAGRALEAAQDIDHGRLAGAVRADQAEHFAAPDLQVDPAQGPDAAKGDGNAAGFQPFFRWT